MDNRNSVANFGNPLIHIFGALVVENFDRSKAGAIAQQAIGVGEGGGRSCNRRFLATRPPQSKAAFS
ncbi:MAG TPA: hypothetical protein VGC61_02195 [Pyrinomonadaceae bacterium]|jgi:hypothetical protein